MHHFIIYVSRLKEPLALCGGSQAVAFAIYGNFPMIAAVGIFRY
jgi:hypothetical protein